MRRAYVILIAMLLCPFGIRAQESSSTRFTFGAEWGYVGVFYSGYHYNFYAPEGYRADPRGYGFTYDNNAEAYLHAGYDINKNHNIALYLGITAIGDYHHAVPLSVRLTRYYGTDQMKDRWLTFIDLGSGISLKERPQALISGKIGMGYRLSLSPDTKLDFIAALKCVLTHPDIQYYGIEISHDRINRNNAYISAFSLGMALTF